jgi:hypothetical protein
VNCFQILAFLRSCASRLISKSHVLVLGREWLDSDGNQTTIECEVTGEPG